MRVPLPLLCLLLVLAPACADGRGDAQTGKRAADPVRLEVGPVVVNARLAMTAEERARGLAGVTSLAPDEGMLFVYPTPARRRFWMNGCLIPLDIAFLDKRGRVLHVDTVQPPASPDAPPPETRRSAPCVYVLEVQSGFFARHGLGAGAKVKIPESVRPAAAQ